MPLPDPARPAAVDLSERVVLVTGATGGLGRPIALAAAKAGATVVVQARVVRKLEALYDEIVAMGAPEPLILPLDLAKAGANDFGNVASAIEAQLGRLDALVHTAAQLGSLGPVEHQGFDTWLNVLRVNLAATLGLTRSVARLLEGSADASVTFTLDTRGEAPKAYWGAYAASKAGLSALATIVADEWETRERVRVNAIVPGPIRTSIRNQTHPGEDAAKLPLPEAIVPLYLHLLSGQRKDESGVRIDAQAWLAGLPAVSSLLP
jgi:NAD(P)-dependent dehydrogenase (short-subunit alcohol dehydrogenase family)